MQITPKNTRSFNLYTRHRPHTFLRVKTTLKMCCLIALSSLTLSSKVHSVDFNLSPATADAGSDREFLQQLMIDTWASLDAMVDDSTGLPQDKNTPGGHTNTTNIGLYLSSLCVAQQMKLIEPDAALKRAERIIESLESFQRVRGFMPNFIPVDLSDNTSHGTMAVSDFNKLATGLIMSRQTWPTLAPRINAFLDVIEWGILYDRNSGNTYWGLDLESGNPVGQGSLWLTADTRLASFMMIATQAAPAELWSRLNRDPKHTEVGRILAPGYEFGALFMHAMDGIFIPEHDTEVGESVGNLTWHQILLAQKKGYPLWGWSNCFIPNSGYTEGGFVPERVVSPYSVALVLEYYPQHATRNLREMVRFGGTIAPQGYEGKQWGLRDSYDMEYGIWDQRYLSLDQSMLFLSLANYLHDQVVRKTYTKDPLIAKGLELIEPYRKRDPSLIELWRERDDELIQLTGVHAYAADAPECATGTITADANADDEALQASDTDERSTESVVVDEIPLDRNSINENGQQFQVSGTSGAVFTAFNKRNREGELLHIFRFSPKDISSLDRLELDIEVLAANQRDLGYMRVFLEDRFQQKRYAYVKLDKNVHTYSIPARDLAGILLDESAVQVLVLSLHYSPWYHTSKRMLATRGILKINAARLISSKSVD